VKYFLILNPGSKGGKSAKRFAAIFKLLDQYQVNYDYKVINNLEEAYSLSQEANKTGYNVVVAVGGDGTINRALNGFYDQQGKRISAAKLGVIYSGTSPDFCKSYHIPIKLEKAVMALIKGDSLNIQIGKIKYSGTLDKMLDGQPIGDNNKIKVSYFACCANFGIGPLLADKANSGVRKILGDFLGTFFSLMRILSSYQANSFMVKREGQIDKIERVHSISVGRTFYIASGIKVNNALVPGDRRFYILTVQNLTLRNWPGVLRTIYCGKQIINSQVVSLDYGKSIEIYANNAHPEIEFDGDRMGFLPCQIEVAEDSLDIVGEQV
jgi:diacylglycerol kinase family enzyme